MTLKQFVELLSSLPVFCCLNYAFEPMSWWGRIPITVGIILIYDFGQNIRSGRYE